MWKQFTFPSYDIASQRLGGRNVHICQRKLDWRDFKVIMLIGYLEGTTRERFPQASRDTLVKHIMELDKTIRPETRKASIENESITNHKMLFIPEMDHLSCLGMQEIMSHT